MLKSLFDAFSHLQNAPVEPDKFHQKVLTIMMIFAAIAFKIENVCPTLPSSSLTSVETDGRKQFH